MKGDEVEACLCLDETPSLQLRPSLPMDSAQSMLALPVRVGRGQQDAQISRRKQNASEDMHWSIADAPLAAGNPAPLQRMDAVPETAAGRRPSQLLWLLSH